MNIYLISQSKRGWDIYESAVVIAETWQEARMTHPDGRSHWGSADYDLDSWCDISKVSVKLIGVAVNKEKPRVVCSDFSAG